MVRTVVRPDAPKIDVPIPAEYVGKEIEILVFPVNQTPSYGTEKQAARRQAAFQDFKKYRGTLPVDFDYKRELAEYRNERYGHSNDRLD